MSRLIIFMMAGIGMFSSCSSSKKIQSAIVIKDTTVAEIKPVDIPAEDTAAVIKDLYSQIQSNQVKVTTFAAKVDVKYKDQDGKKYDVNANIRMYYDSVIWISVTGALGIEGLRAYITHDSVKLIDKQNKVYISKAVSYLQEITELPLSLLSLQDLLLGNPVFLDSAITSFSRSAGAISLLSVGDFFKNLYTVDAENKSVQSSKLDDVTDLRSRTCLLLYKDYENKKGVNFSVQRSIHVAEKKTLEIELEFKQYNFNETLSFPFTVPKNYKRN